MHVLRGVALLFANADELAQTASDIAPDTQGTYIPFAGSSFVLVFKWRLQFIAVDLRVNFRLFIRHPVQRRLGPVRRNPEQLQEHYKWNIARNIHRRLPKHIIIFVIFSGIRKPVFAAGNDKHMHWIPWIRNNLQGQNNFGFLQNTFERCHGFGSIVKANPLHWSHAFCRTINHPNSKILLKRNKLDYIRYVLKIFVVGNGRSHGRSRALPVYTHFIFKS
jgi:hypothetical protein